MMPRIALSVALTLAIGLVALSCSKPTGDGPRAFSEEEMAPATEAALASFDAFLERFYDPQPGDESFNVKVRVEDDNGVEFLWLGDLDLDSEPFSGVIGNEPSVVESVEMGQRYDFYMDEIGDWMYMSNGTMKGNYTLRVALKTMPRDEADALRAAIGW